MSLRLSDCTSPCHSPGAVTHCQIPAACQSKDKGQAAAAGGLQAAGGGTGLTGRSSAAERHREWLYLQKSKSKRSPCCELSLCLGEALTHSSQHDRCCPTEQPLPHARHPATGRRLGLGIPRGWQPAEGPVPVPERAGAAHRQPSYSRSRSF